jgi:hypothetical protein
LFLAPKEKIQFGAVFMSQRLLFDILEVLRIYQTEIPAMGQQAKVLVLM